jgi:hypothetical protein
LRSPAWRGVQKALHAKGAKKKAKDAEKSDAEEKSRVRSPSPT